MVIAGAVASIIYISKNRIVETDQQVQAPVQETLPEQAENQNFQQSRINVENQVAGVTEQAKPIPEAEPLVQDAEAEEQNIQEEQNSQEEVNQDNPVVTLPEPSRLPASRRTNQSPLISREAEIILTIVKDVAYLSAGISKNTELQGLLAYQSYLMQRRYEGDTYSPDIYKALYEALKKLISPAYNIYSVRSSVKAMEWISRNRKYSCCQQRWKHQNSVGNDFK